MTPARHPRGTDETGLPTPFYERDGIVIYHADCRDILPLLAAESVDMVCTDPPYDDYYADSVQVIQVAPDEFAVRMNAGGRVVTRSIREWVDDVFPPEAANIRTIERADARTQAVADALDLIRTIATPVQGVGIVDCAGWIATARRLVAQLDGASDHTGRAPETEATNGT